MNSDYLYSSVPGPRQDKARCPDVSHASCVCVCVSCIVGIPSPVRVGSTAPLSGSSGRADAPDGVPASHCGDQTHRRTQGRCRRRRARAQGCTQGRFTAPYTDTHTHSTHIHARAPSIHSTRIVAGVSTQPPMLHDHRSSPSMQRVHSALAYATSLRLWHVGRRATGSLVRHWAWQLVKTSQVSRSTVLIIWLGLEYQLHRWQCGVRT